MSDAEPAGTPTPPDVQAGAPLRPEAALPPLFTSPPPATTTDAAGGEVLDFSEPDRPAALSVRIGPADDDVFAVAPALPAKLAFEFQRAARTVTAAGEQADPSELLAMFQRIVLPSDAERFDARMGDLARPISLQQLVRIIQGLFERYGLRPTAPPPASSDGRPNPDGGMPWTAASPSPARTP
jgi:hypothetical protein